jgi:mitogen-activated protein kinase kinase kinase 7
MAPEILKNKLDKDQSTKLDVYSFGIIMFEVFFEEVPYRNNDEKFESVIALGTQIASGLRPNIPKNLVQDVSDAEKMFLTLMEACWDQNPSIRPSFEEIFSVFMEIGVLTKK